LEYGSIGIPLIKGNSAGERYGCFYVIYFVQLLMLMNLTSEATGKTWTLRPNRSYIIGSSQDCDIVIAEQGLSPQHLQLGFNSVSNEWWLERLNEDADIIIEGIPTTKQALTQLTRVSVANEVLIAIPQMESSVANYELSQANPNVSGTHTTPYFPPKTQYPQDNSISIKLNLPPIAQQISKVNSTWKVMSTTDRLLSGILLLSALNTLVLLSSIPLIMTASSVISKMEAFANRMEPIVNQVESQLNKYLP
jgi:Inner membrane component of T3SS, cytoplasmic domain